jgi:superfamily I DNA/RNA helicase
MSVHFFEGPAGTGKTFKLIEYLNEVLEENPLSDSQFILALTFMHGSRKRLSEKLSEIPNLKGKYQCMTIDSFSLSLIRRFRDYIKETGTNINGLGMNFDRICNICGDILHTKFISKWVASVYPIIIADEFQDCSTERVSIFDGLKDTCIVLAAADEFQDLNCVNCSFALAWLRYYGHGEEL